LFWFNDMVENMSDKRDTQKILQNDYVREFLSALSTSATGEPTGETIPPAMGLVDALLRDVVRERSTDIHLDPHADSIRLRLRIDGIVHDAAVISHEQGLRLINQFKVLGNIDPVVLFTPEESRQTYVLDNHELDLRIASAACLNGEKMTIRVLDLHRVEQNIQNLGLAEDMLESIQYWMDNVEGMFLVTGPTGCGKTTTLYALLHTMKLLNRNIVTIEDPAEYDIDGVTQLQVDREHEFGFAEGIKAMLRLDPDYLLVGEIRDSESARSALDVAASGRVLLTTLHSRDAVGAVTSLRNWGLEDYEIATTLSFVVAQRLVRRLCPNCRYQAPPTEKQRNWLQAMELGVPDQVWHPGGCEQCKHIGYKGRTGVFEVWPLYDEDWDQLLSHKNEKEIRSRLAERGHRFLVADGAAKAAEGTTSIEELRWMSGAIRLGEKFPKKNGVSAVP